MMMIMTLIIIILLIKPVLLLLDFGGRYFFLFFVVDRFKTFISLQIPFKRQFLFVKLFLINILTISHNSITLARPRLVTTEPDSKNKTTLTPK